MSINQNSRFLLRRVCFIQPTQHYRCTEIHIINVNRDIYGKQKLRDELEPQSFTTPSTSPFVSGFAWSTAISRCSSVKSKRFSAAIRFESVASCEESSVCGWENNLFHCKCEQECPGRRSRADVPIVEQRTDGFFYHFQYTSDFLFRLHSSTGRMIRFHFLLVLARRRCR